MNQTRHTLFAGDAHLTFIPGAHTRCRCYLTLLPLLASLGQSVLPYHVDRVESNDSLYALSDVYVDELSQLLNSVKILTDELQL